MERGEDSLLLKAHLLTGTGTKKESIRTQESVHTTKNKQTNKQKTTPKTVALELGWPTSGKADINGWFIAQQDLSLKDLRNTRK